MSGLVQRCENTSCRCCRLVNAYALAAFQIACFVVLRIRTLMAYRTVNRYYRPTGLTMPE